MSAVILFTVMLILWCIYCRLYKVCYLERTGQVIAWIVFSLYLYKEYSYSLWLLSINGKNFMKQCLMRVAATMTQSHYSLPSLILNVYRNTTCGSCIYLTFSSQAPLEHPAVHFIGSVTVKLNLNIWVGRYFHLLSHLSTI